MQLRTRRRLWIAFAVLALVATGAKIFKAIYRGESIQSRVHPIR